MSNRPGGEEGGGAGHAGRMNLNDPRLTGPAIAAGRVVLGVVAIARPALPARCWVSAERAGEPGVQVLARALGARDVALGVVALAACARGSAGSRRATVGLGAFADGVDAAATLLAWRALPRGSRYLALAAAGGAAALGAHAALTGRQGP
jgi:hypothetical protein